MTDTPLSVLFLCTGNSARSVMAEALLNHHGGGRFRAFSAGSNPTGVVNPFTLRTLEAHAIGTGGFTSKSWDEFARPDAPRLDAVITVCGNAAGETCPVWPSHPVTAHWGFEDPAAAIGTDAEKLRCFEDIFTRIERTVLALTGLDDSEHAPDRLRDHLRRIGTTTQI